MTSTWKFACPNCDAVLEVPQDYPGGDQECPRCQSKLTIPVPDDRKKMHVRQDSTKDLRFLAAIAAAVGAILIFSQFALSATGGEFPIALSVLGILLCFLAAGAMLYVQKKTKKDHKRRPPMKDN